MAYFVYILKSLKNGSYYTGSTQDLSSRLERHNQGRSKHTKKGMLWEVIYHEKFPDRSSALKREMEIKRRKSRKYIESLIRASRQT